MRAPLTTQVVHQNRAKRRINPRLREDFWSLTFLRSPLEQYSMANSGRSFKDMCVTSSGTSRAVTTLMWFNLREDSLMILVVPPRSVTSPLTPNLMRSRWGWREKWEKGLKMTQTFSWSGSLGSICPCSSGWAPGGTFSQPISRWFPAKHAKLYVDILPSND